MIEIVSMNENNYRLVAEISRKNLNEGWSEKTLFNQLENPNDHTFLAFYDGFPAGFLSLWIIAGEGEINNIAVEREFRKKGIASALMQKMLENFSDVKKYYLEVRKSNENAIKLYKKFGFDFCGERKNFYSNPTENALLMCYSTSEI